MKETKQKAKKKREQEELPSQQNECIGNIHHPQRVRPLFLLLLFHYLFLSFSPSFFFNAEVKERMGYVCVSWREREREREVVQTRETKTTRKRVPFRFCFGLKTAKQHKEEDNKRKRSGRVRWERSKPEISHTRTRTRTHTHIYINCVNMRLTVCVCGVLCCDEETKLFCPLSHW